ncbi:MAG: hypothetical protein LBS69_01425 [Prevotellaceae bacterium]|nr:hypothetical protein [Prevotellaceae bacterium]
MKKLIFTMIMAALVCSAGMFSSCGSSDDDDNENEWVYDHTKDGIVGEWYSAGTDVAPIFKTPTFGNLDSLYAKFNADKTYRAEEFKEGKVPGNIYTGTYTQTKSSVGNIWIIHIDQTLPQTGVSEGIFEITKGTDGSYRMQYEIVQTHTGLIPATPEGGFGSSLNGAYGDALIQKYVRLIK